MEAEKLRELLVMANIALPLQSDPVKNEGEYGDGGPDSHTGYDSFEIADAEGRVLFDSLNCDHRIAVVHEEFDDDRHYAWDEASARNAKLFVAAVNALPTLLDALATQAAEIEAMKADIAEYQANLTAESNARIAAEEIHDGYHEGYCPKCDAAIAARQAGEAK